MLVGSPLNDWLQLRHVLIMPACSALPRHVPSANGLHASRLSRHVLGYFGTSVDTQQWAQPVAAGVHGVSSKKCRLEVDG